MSVQQWRAWTKSKPFHLQWFIWLVLLRPVVDSLYFLKNISPLLSPLYIVGLLTPLLAIWGMMRNKRSGRSRLDLHFKVWSACLLLGCLLIFFFDPLSLLTVEFILKLSLPVYLFFFLRCFIRDKKDLNGILQTFLYSGIFVAAVLVFELVVNPIRVVESRGLERIQGNFGDVVNYGIYIVFCLLIAAYRLLASTRQGMRKHTTVLLVVVFIGIAGLLNIHHIASYITFAAVGLLFLVFNLRSNRETGLVLVVIGAVAAFYFVQDPFQEAVQERISPLLEQDLKVYQGELESERLLHGRVGRWKHMWGIFSEQPVFAQFFGYPLQMEYAYHFVGIGSHNDFIRLLFFTGYLGLLVYLLLLAGVYRASIGLSGSLRYLVLGALAVLLLYSVSITPTFYAPFMYLVMSIFAFVALPPRVNKPNKRRQGTPPPHVTQEGPDTR